MNELSIYVRVYLWALNSVPLICASTICFDYYSFEYSFKSGSVPAMFFFLKVVLLFGIFCVSYNF